MSHHFFDETKLLEGIHREIEAQVKNGMDEVIEHAKAELEKKLRENLAGIVLNLLAYYNVERTQKGIQITVQNKAVSNG